MKINHSIAFITGKRHMSMAKRLSFISLCMISFSYSSANFAAPTDLKICASCHGVDGIAIGADSPNLAGQKKDYLIKQLKAFRDGSRINPTMNTMAKSLSDKTISKLAQYFSSQAIHPVAKQTIIKLQDDPISNHEFPVDTFVTLKKAAGVVTLPNKQQWQGKPNMLFNAITPDGKILLATSPSENTVTLFNTENGEQLANIAVGKAPKGVKVTPDGKLAYVSNQGSANISVIDLNTRQWVNNINVAQGPHNVRFTSDGKIAYATLQGGAGIAVIDTQAQKMTHIIATPGITGPHNLDLSKDEKLLYVRDFVQHVAVIDIASQKVIKVITVGKGHGGIDVFPNGKFIATAAIGDDFVTIIDASDLSHFDIKVGNGPHGIRASKDNQWLYVTLTKDNQIAIIDTHTWKVHKKVSTGEFPFWIAVRGNP